jgi:hypothetical protein
MLTVAIKNLFNQVAHLLGQIAVQQQFEDSYW